jgi:hypothetical protein
MKRTFTIQVWDGLVWAIIPYSCLKSEHGLESVFKIYHILKMFEYFEIEQSDILLLVVVTVAVVVAAAA